MGFKGHLHGAKCSKCLNGKHSQCVSWDCQCKYCVRTVEDQRKKALRLDAYWSKQERKSEIKMKNLFESNDGRVLPHRPGDESIDPNEL